MKEGKAHMVRVPAHKIESEEHEETKPGIRLTVPEDRILSRDFSYTKKLFLQRLVLQIILMALIAILLSPVFLNLDLPATAAVLGLYAVFLVVSSISPFLTSHTITPDHLILRQGWYFKVTIPIENIDEIEESDEFPKVGVKFALRQSKLYVTASRYGLVRIALKDAKRFPLALGKKAEEIVVDVEQASRFIELGNIFLERYREPIPASQDQSF
ncbi:MAG: hypothetical protein JSV43_07615 [Methanobacteriota archaeon]|nr:MAG: hypothetical protein JSV43_07615 [Euryarchaeota archaeon]